MKDKGNVFAFTRNITRYFLSISKRCRTQLKQEIEASPHTLTDVIQKYSKNDIQATTSAYRELTRVHTI